MPIYSYRCDKCSVDREQYHSLANMEAVTVCPVCGETMHRNAVALGVAVRGEYKKPIVSDAMGFIADDEDVAEHRKRFPNIDLVIEDGCARPKFRSLGQKRAYMKAMNWADVKDYA
jgi:putative FmdB family regulatory protein